MRAYLKHMRIPLIILGVLLGLYLIMSLIRSGSSKEYVRGNDSCNGQRVFDYADILTDREEEKLQELIEKRQDEIGCDIVLVVLDEPLKDYALAYEDQLGYISEDEYVMVYADNFYDENGFGYDRAHGDGCVYVDNWNRSDSAYGYAYSCFSTSGRVEQSFSMSEIDSVINNVNEIVEDNPYEAYKGYVEEVARMMSGKLIGEAKMPFFTMILAALVVAAIYLFVHISTNRGKKTTVSTTYVNGGRPFLRHRRDVLVDTKVTRRHIERSSSGGGGGGGGGGHRVSAGGFSHGGGVGRR